MTPIKLWWARNFKVITRAEAESLKLGFYTNVYGDNILRLNCRSIWIDGEGRQYRVKELIYDYDPWKEGILNNCYI